MSFQTIPTTLGILSHTCPHVSLVKGHFGVRHPFCRVSYGATMPGRASIRETESDARESALRGLSGEAPVP